MIVQPQLVSAILDAYNVHADVLPITKRIHFFSRAYAVTGDSQYVPAIRDYLFSQRVPAIKHGAAAFSTGVVPMVESRIPPAHLDDVQKQRYIDREEVYKAYPRVRWFDHVTVHLTYAYNHRLHTTMLADEWEVYRKGFLASAVQQLYTNDQIVRYDSSFAINSSIFLEELFAIPVAAETRKVFRNLYWKGAQSGSLDDKDLRSFLYGGTHLVIAQSLLYQRHVDPVPFEWLLEYYSDHATEICERASLDVLAEIVLCYLLTRTANEYTEALAMYMQRIHELWKPEQLQSVDFLIQKEHTTSVLLLVFSGLGHLFSAADLSDHQ